MGTTTNGVTGRHRPAPPAVDSHLSRPAHDGEGDVLARWKDDRTDRQGEWIHGHEHQVAKRWLEDRSTAGQRVSRRAGRGRDHDAVCIDDAHRLATDVDLNPQHARRAGVIDDHLVEADRSGNRPFAAAEHDLEDGPLLDPILAVEKAKQALIDLIFLELCQEPEPPEIAREY